MVIESSKMFNWPSYLTFYPKHLNLHGKIITQIKDHLRILMFTMNEISNYTRLTVVAI